MDYVITAFPDWEVFVTVKEDDKNGWRTHILKN